MKRYFPVVLALAQLLLGASAHGQNVQPVGVIDSTHSAVIYAVGKPGTNTSWTTVSVQLVSHSASGTVTFRVSGDCANYQDISAIPSNSTTSATTATAAGYWTLATAGARCVEVSRTAWSSGSFDVYMSGSLNAGGNSLPASISTGAVTVGDVGISSFPDNEPFNVAQIAGIAPNLGAGAVSTGTQRVTLGTNDGIYTPLGNLTTSTTTLAPGATGSTAFIAGGIYNETPPTFTDGQKGAQQLTSVGSARVEETWSLAIKDYLDQIQQNTSNTDINTSNIYDNMNADATAGATVKPNGPQSMAAYYSSLPTPVTDGQAVRFLSDAYGRLHMDVATMNGVTPLMGAGNTGTGSPRVTIASDQAVLAAVGAGATGSAVPANAMFMASKDASGNLTGDIQCTSSKLYDTNTSGNTELVAIDGSKHVYVCAYEILSGGTVNVSLVAGTGTACASAASGATSTGTSGASAGLTPAWQFTTQTGKLSAWPTHGYLLDAGSANALCLKTSGGVAVQAQVWYVQR